MRMLIADADAGVFAMNSARRCNVSCPVKWPAALCAGGEYAAVCCGQSRECFLIHRERLTCVSAIAALPGVNAMKLSPCGRYLYQLSGEADCLHVRKTETGELLCAASAGVYPQSMALHPSGEKLLAAGGAVGEAYLFSAPDLQRLHTYAAPHPCFAADFWRGGAVLLCAVEGEDIHLQLCTADGLGVRVLLEMPCQPGTLCVCPDGLHALVSTAQGLLKVNLLNGMIAWQMKNRPMCMHMETAGGLALLSGALDGSVRLIDPNRPKWQKILCTGGEAHACFL